MKEENIRDSESHLVLRTFYIQKEMDDKLRYHAFQLGKSKNDIIRRGIHLALEEIETVPQENQQSISSKKSLEHSEIAIIAKQPLVASAEAS
jgi:predicted DNA-binding protein